MGTRPRFSETLAAATTTTAATIAAVAAAAGAAASLHLIILTVDVIDSPPSTWIYNNIGVTPFSTTAIARNPGRCTYTCFPERVIQ